LVASGLIEHATEIRLRAERRESALAVLAERIDALAAARMKASVEAAGWHTTVNF